MKSLASLALQVAVAAGICGAGTVAYRLSSPGPVKTSFAQHLDECAECQAQGDRPGVPECPTARALYRRMKAEGDRSNPVSAVSSR